MALTLAEMHELAPTGGTIAVFGPPKPKMTHIYQGRPCIVIRKGMTISRIQFEDGTTQAAWNSDLQPLA